MKFYFIRHGQTTCNAAGKHQGWGPIGLTDKGFAQAKAAREYISPIRFDRIYASDLLRTRQTAEVIFPDEYHSGKISFEAELREVDTGALYGMGYDDLYPIFGDEYARRRLELDCGPYGAESSQHLRARVGQFMKKLEALSESEPSLERIAIVAHGGIIRSALAIITGQPEDVPVGRLPVQIDNCSVTVLEYANSRWRIVQLNYHGKLV